MYLNLDGTNHATRLLLFLICYTQDFFPQLTTKERYQQIKKRYQAGEGINALARVFGIAPQRVGQIVKSIKGSKSEELAINEILNIER